MSRSAFWIVLFIYWKCVEIGVHDLINRKRTCSINLDQFTRTEHFQVKPALLFYNVNIRRNIYRTPLQRILDITTKIGEQWGINLSQPMILFIAIKTQANQWMVSALHCWAEHREAVTHAMCFMTRKNLKTILERFYYIKYLPFLQKVIF